MLHWQSPEAPHQQSKTACRGCQMLSGVVNSTHWMALVFADQNHNYKLWQILMSYHVQHCGGIQTAGLELELFLQLQKVNVIIESLYYNSRFWVALPCTFRSHIKSPHPSSGAQQCKLLFTVLSWCLIGCRTTGSNNRGLNRSQTSGVAMCASMLVLTSESLFPSEENLWTFHVNKT